MKRWGGYLPLACLLLTFVLAEEQRTCLPEFGENGDAFARDRKDVPGNVYKYGCKSCYVKGTEVHVIYSIDVNATDIQLEVLRRGTTGTVTVVPFDLVVILDGPKKIQILLESNKLQLDNLILVDIRQNASSLPLISASISQEGSPKEGHMTKSDIVIGDRDRLVDPTDVLQTTKNIYETYIKDKFGHLTSWSAELYVLKWDLAVGVPDDCTPSSGPLYPPPDTTESPDDKTQSGTSNKAYKSACSQYGLLALIIIHTLQALNLLLS